jgi:hypothetical protein
VKKRKLENEYQRLEIKLSLMNLIYQNLLIQSARNQKIGLDISNYPSVNVKYMFIASVY